VLAPSTITPMSVPEGAGQTMVPAALSDRNCEDFSRYQAKVHCLAPCLSQVYGRSRLRVAEEKVSLHSEMWVSNWRPQSISSRTGDRETMRGPRGCA
jgi:hypothetical protein